MKHFIFVLDTQNLTNDTYKLKKGSLFFEIKSYFEKLKLNYENSFFIETKNIDKLPLLLNRKDSILLICGKSALYKILPDIYKNINEFHYAGIFFPFYTNNSVYNAIFLPSIRSLLFNKDNIFFKCLSKVFDCYKIKFFSCKVKPTNVIFCKDKGLFDECVLKIKKDKKFAFDFETTGTDFAKLLPFHANGESMLYSIAIAFSDGIVYTINLFDHFPESINKFILNVLYSIFTDSSIIKIGHNIKFDLGYFFGFMNKKYNYSIPTQNLGILHDTGLLSWIFDGRTANSSLKANAFKQLGVDDWAIKVTDLDSLKIEDVLYYNALDSFYTFELYNFFSLNIKEKKFLSLYKNLLLPSMKSFLLCELRGVNLNLERKNEHTEDFKKQTEVLLSEIQKVSGVVGLKPRSTKQLISYFVGKGYELVKKTSTGGYSMDMESLEYILNKYDDPLASIILKYRKLAKIQTTYLEGLDKVLCLNSKMHPSFNLMGTVTGRTSANNPNIQNFPKRDFSYIRDMVVAPKGYKLCCFDYGQIEARLFAVVTADPVYIKDLLGGYDIHKETALWIFKNNLGLDEDVAIKKRSLVKNRAVFPAFYGAGAKTIGTGLGISESLATKFKEHLFNRYKKVKLWQKMLSKQEQSLGYVESLFGRVRKSPMRYNEMLNFTTQSTASDMTLSSMNIASKKYRLAFMIHDDISFYIKDDGNLESSCEEILKIMLTVPFLYIHKHKKFLAYAPLSVDCTIGKNWGEQETLFSRDSNYYNFDLVNSVSFAKQYLK